MPRFAIFTASSPGLCRFFYSDGTFGPTSGINNVERMQAYRFFEKCRRKERNCNEFTRESHYKALSCRCEGHSERLNPDSALYQHPHPAQLLRGVHQIALQLLRRTQAQFHCSGGLRPPTWDELPPARAITLDSCVSRRFCVTLWIAGRPKARAAQCGRQFESIETSWFSKG